MESRNVHRTLQLIAQMDDKFDIEKEEIKLLLDAKRLKARVLYNSPRDYVDEIQPKRR